MTEENIICTILWSAIALKTAWLSYRQHHGRNVIKDMARRMNNLEQSMGHHTPPEHPNTHPPEQGD